MKPPGKTRILLKIGCHNFRPEDKSQLKEEGLSRNGKDI